MAKFLSGFVCITGSPNVGKSTLMNAMIGQKVAIVSSRAQTTRNKIMGVLTRKEYQIIFIDTPGIHMPKDKLGQYMVKTAYNALDEVECALFVIDAQVGLKERDEAILQKLKRSKAPVLAAINKIDAVCAARIEEIEERLSREQWLKGIIKISATHELGLIDLEKRLESFLTPGPMYFPEDMVTDMPERIVCAEFIRESMLELLKDEVPYGIGVDIDKIAPREDRELTDVYATIYCERESQKGIVIGKKGTMLRQIGETSRKQIEWLMGTRINLQLWVKVKDDWRNKSGDLRELGYE